MAGSAFYKQLWCARPWMAGCVFPPLFRLSIFHDGRAQAFALGDRRHLRASAFLADLRNHPPDISESAQRTDPGRLRPPVSDRHAVPGEEKTSESGIRGCASRLARWRCAVFRQFHFSNPIRARMDHVRLGVRGLRSSLLISRRAPSGFALYRTCIALHPAVLEYHRRSPTPIWNWYLYGYGLPIVFLFGGAWLFRSPLQTIIERMAPTLLNSLGAILTFLLLNIEIADYFSVGPTLTFSFSGNFARDMTYSIAWALFAFALLLDGMKQRTGWVRYAGVVLLLVTLLKLFLHDLGNLSQLYRIGAFIGVAIVLIVASFVYQRFLAPRAGKSPPPL